MKTEGVSATNYKFAAVGGESIRIFYTIVRNKDNRTVIIPNSKLSNEVMVKFNEPLLTKGVNASCNFSPVLSYLKGKKDAGLCPYCMTSSKS